MKPRLEVGIGPGDIVLDGDPAPSPPPIFAHVLWPNGWVDQNTTWYGVGLGPGHIVLDEAQPRTAPSRKGAQQPPLLGPCLLWPHGRPSQLLMSSCYTAHGRESLYFTMGRHFPPPENCPFPWEDLDPHLIHDPWPTEFTSQTTSRSIQRFLQGSRPTDRQSDRQTDRRTIPLRL